MSLFFCSLFVVINLSVLIIWASLVDAWSRPCSANTTGHPLGEREGERKKEVPLIQECNKGTFCWNIHSSLLPITITGFQPPARLLTLPNLFTGGVRCKPNKRCSFFCWPARTRTCAGNAPMWIQFILCGQKAKAHVFATFASKRTCYSKREDLLFSFALWFEKKTTVNLKLMSFVFVLFYFYFFFIQRCPLGLFSHRTFVSWYLFSVNLCL